MISFSAIDWAMIGSKGVQLILCFGIVVIIHELGHFIPAKIFKCRVEKFYVFFDLGFSLFKRKIGETVYGIGWIPMGGYVKISGMIEDILDKKKEKLPPQPWEYRTKKPWQRLIITAGGAASNIILSWMIYSMLIWVFGSKYTPTQNIVSGVYVDSLGKSIGLRESDQVVGVHGEKLDDFDQLRTLIVNKNAQTIQVLREGKMVDINIPKKVLVALEQSDGGQLVYPKFPVIVGELNRFTVFTYGRLQPNDKVISIGEYPISSVYELKGLRKKFRDREEVAVTVQRNNKETVVVKLILDPLPIFGFFPRTVDEFIKPAIRQYSFLESLAAGAQNC